MHIFHELQLTQCKSTTTTSVQCFYIGSLFFLASGVETIAPKKGTFIESFVNA